MLLPLKKTACLIAILLTISIAAHAQSAVLVMLRSEKNRIAYLESVKKTEQAKTLKADANKIIEVTVNDFRDNYTRTPVYYFADTNLQLIKDQKFDGVILDDQLKPVVFPFADRTDYLIVFYGIPPTEITSEGNAEEEQRIHRAINYPNNGIVILDHEFKRMRKPNVHYVYLRATGKRVIRNRPEYNYASEDFNISYYEMGGKLQRELGEKGVKLPR